MCGRGKTRVGKVVGAQKMGRLLSLLASNGNGSIEKVAHVSGPEEGEARPLPSCRRYRVAKEIGMKRLLSLGMALVLGLAALADTAQAAMHPPAKLKHTRTEPGGKKARHFRSYRFHIPHFGPHRGGSTGGPNGERPTCPTPRPQ
jgi:hypothetical protein